MNRTFLSRRHFVMGLTAASVLPLGRLAANQATSGELLPLTPSDYEGPYYPVEYPDDSDNDLLQIVGREQVAPGRLAYVHGRVMDRSGTRIDGARVEIWQCDNDGVYHHPRAPGNPNEAFQGFGAMVTDRQGGYHFRAMRPRQYEDRTPHIHFRVEADGFSRLTTQLYVAEEAELNGKDTLYQRHSAEEQALLTTAFRPLGDDPSAPVVAEFNIVLG